MDTLSALFVAAESLNVIENSMGTDVDKEIIILDTGVCTSGVLNFCIPEYRDLISYEGKIWENNAMSAKWMILLRV